MGGLGTAVGTAAGLDQIGADDQIGLAVRFQQRQFGDGLVLEKLGFARVGGPAPVAHPDAMTQAQVVCGDDTGFRSGRDEAF